MRDKSYASSSAYSTLGDWALRRWLPQRAATVPARSEQLRQRYWPCIC
jgi:hypothetical protein